MHIEYEATFEHIDREDMRRRLKTAGATCVRPEFLQRRVVFHLPKGHEIPGGWLRVRDEGNRITCSLKVVDGDGIEDQKELLVEVSSMETMTDLLEHLGARQKAYQETKRELWTLEGVEITIDEWPWLEPFLEVEGQSEADVRRVAEELGLDWSKALFCSVDGLYAKTYKMDNAVFNDQTPRVTFDEPNPFMS